MARADIAFLLDASESIQENWDTILAYVRALINQLEVDEDVIRVAATQFSTEAHLIYYLNRYFTRQGASNALVNLRQIEGSTNLRAGFDFIRNNIFQRVNGDRPEAPNILVVITDGFADDRENALLAANRLKNDGTQIYMVGVGLDASEDELMRYASDSRDVTYVESPNQLLSTVASVISRVCPERFTSKYWRQKESLVEEIITDIVLVYMKNLSVKVKYSIF